MKIKIHPKIIKKKLLGHQFNSKKNIKKIVQILFNGDKIFMEILCNTFIQLFIFILEIFSTTFLYFHFLIEKMGKIETKNMF
jgi:hypothetical protein